MNQKMKIKMNHNHNKAVHKIDGSAIIKINEVNHHKWN